MKGFGGEINASLRKSPSSNRPIFNAASLFPGNAAIGAVRDIPLRSVTEEASGGRQARGTENLEVHKRTTISRRKGLPSSKLSLTLRTKVRDSTLEVKKRGGCYSPDMH